MRLPPFAAALAAFAVAGGASVIAARTAVAVVEDVSLTEVRAALAAQGHDWAEVQADGLQVILEGAAPTEAMRFRAMSVAGGIVDASRVIDNMRVVEAELPPPPDFAIEILRNDSGVSLIGLIPAGTDRDALIARLEDAADGLPVTDLLDMADHPVPDHWSAALRYATRALETLPHSKLSVRPGRVRIEAISDSPEAQRALESTLTRLKPDTVRLTMRVSAPRPVITPFTARFVIDGAGARFDACSADTPEAQSAITAAAAEAGAEGDLDCTLGLGVPTGQWGEAVARGIAALAEIGRGSITFSDADVSLVAAQGSDAEAFGRAVGRLENDLPDFFALEAVLPEAPEARPEGAPEFIARLSEEGGVRLSGRLPDPLAGTTVETFARARFGSDVTMATRVTEGLPGNWSMRVLAGLEGLSLLSEGQLTVGPDDVAIEGLTGHKSASADIARLMADKLGQGASFDIDVTYEESLDPIAGLPTPEECLRQIAYVTADTKITFDPGSASITAEARPVVDDIAEIVRRCPELEIEVAGYTDSQGRDEMNLDLSQKRADAVVEALRRSRVPVAGFTPVGYGEADPIADNGTSAGREANRRIEFRLTGAQADSAEQSAGTGEDAQGEAEEATEIDADAPQAMDKPGTGPRARPSEDDE
ncbi:OmpA family protein [Limimaricola hongkongensis]|uniref:OmpA domain protein n=1 Tax=Limimaricola hongkongensis DSM 17492 TaxID=1122180 RepID=A0A017HCC2_9RHOB|nr:OmpA family protein [Limimaricola hongkongensis]EYD72016.1 OmpA domain protein [Limimaricola hongkongensis DSM 17492]